MNKLFLSSILVLLILLTGTVTACGQKPVVIADSNLEIMLRNAIDKPEGAIYAWDLEEIRTLKAGRSDLLDTQGTVGLIDDISGLEYCVNLQILDLNYNPIVDLTPIASLTGLRSLVLHHCELRDISPLASLTNLEVLDVSDNTISDISAVSSLSSLRTLYLFNNNIKYIDPVASLTGLETLLLGTPYISRISTQQFKSPGGMNKVNDLSPLQDCISLEYLNIGGNLVEDLRPLASLVNLKVLSLYANYITDISPLASCINLNELNLNWNVHFGDPSVLLELPHLEKLNIGGTGGEEYYYEYQETWDALETKDFFYFGNDSLP